LQRTVVSGPGGWSEHEELLDLGEMDVLLGGEELSEQRLVLGRHTGTRNTVVAWVRGRCDIPNPFIPPTPPTPHPSPSTIGSLHPSLAHSYIQLRTDHAPTQPPPPPVGRTHARTAVPYIRGALLLATRHRAYFLTAPRHTPSARKKPLGPSPYAPGDC